ncbi:hypothetical protein H0H87_012002 [Tephrocybe sp. NHM501043]|nr:hypothetical protein H0H87_012002 [Tephrocybe sp. NHM501043]
MLDRYRLEYHQYLKAISCKDCQSIVYVDRIGAHLWRGALGLETREYDGVKDRWAMVQNQGHRQYPLPNKKEMLIVEERIMAEVRALSGMDLSAILLTRDDTNKYPPEDWDGQPIQGLPVFKNAFYCLLCEEDPKVKHIYGCFTSDGIGAHCADAHRERQRYRTYWARGDLQTLSRVKGSTAYFKVATVDAPPTTPTTTPPPTPTPAEEARARTTQMLVDLNASALSSAQAPYHIHPFIAAYGIHKFLSDYNSEQLLGLRGLYQQARISGDKLLERAKSIHIPSFFKDCRNIEGVNSTVLRVLTDLEGQGSCHMNPGLVVSKSTGEPIFKFTAKEEAALNSLLEALKDEESADATVSDALWTVFQVFYFSPPSKKAGLSGIYSPVISFILLEFISPDGQAYNNSRLPPFLARCQFAIRLKAFHKFYKVLHSSDVDSSSSSDGDGGSGGEKYMRDLRDFCSLYLSKNNLTPFANIRELMHRLTAIVLGTPRPAYLIWVGDTLKIGDHFLTLGQFKEFLAKKMAGLEIFVEQNLLFGLFKIADFDESLSRISDTGDQLTVGYGILADADATLPTIDTADSARFYNKIIGSGSLGFEAHKQGCDPERYALWMASIHSAVGEIFALCHVTQGLPGRATEEAGFLTVNQQAMPRHLIYDEEHQAGGFHTNYNKDTHITGRYKHILRLLPYRVFRVLIILLRVIRPVELTFLLSGGATPAEMQAGAIAYQTRVFASAYKAWMAPQFSDALERFFASGLPIPMKVRLYRHVAIAFQRRFMSYSNSNKDKSDDSGGLALAADLMAGHSPKVAEDHYARLQGTGNTPSSLREKYAKVSLDWHAMLGFQTTAPNKKEKGKGKGKGK